MAADIVLTSAKFKVTGILKKTKARFFKDLQVGDVLQFENKLSYVGGASNGLYATAYKVSVVDNTDRELSCSFSQNELVRFMGLISVEEVNG